MTINQTNTKSHELTETKTQNINGTQSISKKIVAPSQLKFKKDKKFMFSSLVTTKT